MYILGLWLQLVLFSKGFTARLYHMTGLKSVDEAKVVHVWNLTPPHVTNHSINRKTLLTTMPEFVKLNFPSVTIECRSMYQPLNLECGFRMHYFFTSWCTQTYALVWRQRGGEEHLPCDVGSTYPLPNSHLMGTTWEVCTSNPTQEQDLHFSGTKYQCLQIIDCKKRISKESHKTVFYLFFIYFNERMALFRTCKRNNNNNNNNAIKANGQKN